MKKKSVIFIPARKGSTELKGKNMIKLNGIPLIDYTLDICTKFSNNFITFVSTDSKKILNHSKKILDLDDYLRPKSLSNSKSNVADAIIHGVEWLKRKRKIQISDILVLQPTSPLRKLSDLIKAYKIFKKKKLISLTSVSKVRESSFLHIEKKRNNQKWTYLYKSKKKIYRRQDYPNNHFLVNGAFYFCNYDYFKKKKLLVEQNQTYLFQTEKLYSIDIDSKSDLELSSLLLKKIKN